MQTTSDEKNKSESVHLTEEHIPKLLNQHPRLAMKLIEKNSL
ncbi:hypothetical protein [Lysinibacillus yapensis]|nr:hypothetical protein [Lysinibacillus yapensis]